MSTLHPLLTPLLTASQLNRPELLRPGHFCQIAVSLADQVEGVAQQVLSAR